MVQEIGKNVKDRQEGLQENVDYPVLKNERVGENYYRLSLDFSKDDHRPIPGQFYNIRCNGKTDPLLRRPFSMHRLTKENGVSCLQILYRVIGKGTDWLSTREKGERLDLIGPLGNGFLIEARTDVVLAARGIGIAPLCAVADAVRSIAPESRLHILMGARVKDRVFYQEDLRPLGNLHLYTDDGSLGFRGRAPELLLHLLETGEVPRICSLYACGPATMLMELSILSERFGFNGQVAMETHMGCGFGACLSCAIPLRPAAIKTTPLWKKPALQWSEDGRTCYSSICKDGPVYDIREVDWHEWLA
jgi:dihydroorotate dehydrogenase electron transfer subunit